MTAVRAVVFDLYGTLLQVEQPLFQRRARRLLGIGRREWTEHVLDVLLVTPFDDRGGFVDHLLEAFAPSAGGELRRELLDRLDRELDSARAYRGSAALLSFLRRRGLRLGLLSNLAAPYREPPRELGLLDLFDAVAFSCDRRRAKPDPRLYLDLCAELGAEPGEVLMVGDSMRNDVLAPRRLGLRSLRVVPEGSSGGPPSAFHVGWLDMERELHALVEEGARVRLGAIETTLHRLRPVPDADQGRYNLVMAADAGSGEAGKARRVYLKRYLLPDSAHLEVFTQALLREAGIETPRSGVLEGPEPFLWSLEAPGSKAEELPLSPALAFDIGRHGASAYLFANADYRPRNAFLVNGGDRSRLVMVDYEHCLFNLALDVSGVSNPFDPNELHALGKRELERRIRKRVITPRTCRRNYREFFGQQGRRRELIEPFRQGWIDLTRRAQASRARIESLLRERLRAAPYLILGTRAYRRAMTEVDVDDLLDRLDRDPEAVLESWMEPIIGAVVP